VDIDRTAPRTPRARPGSRLRSTPCGPSSSSDRWRPKRNAGP